MSDEKNLRSGAAPSADSWVVRLTTHLPMSRPRSFFHSSDEWTPELVRATRFPTRQAASAFVEDKGLVTHDVAVLQLLPDGSLMEVPDLRSEAATRGDETDPPSYWLIGHWLGSLYWGPRWGMDCEGNAARFSTAMEAYEQWKCLPADLRRALVLAPSWRKLRTDGATDTTEAAPRGGDGKVADGDGEHSVAAVEFAVRAIDEVLPGLRSEAAPLDQPEKPWHVIRTGQGVVRYLSSWDGSWATWTLWTPSPAGALSWATAGLARRVQDQLAAKFPGLQPQLRLQQGSFPDKPLRSEAVPQQERSRDTWYLYLALAKPVYLGDGEEVWWTKDKASARKFTSAEEVKQVFARLTVHLGTKMYICCDAGQPRVRFEEEKDMKNLRTEGANAPVREDGTTWLLWHKHDNSYLGRPGGFDEEGLATHFASQAEAEQFRDEHVSRRLVGAVVAVPRPKQKLCVEDAPARPSEPSLRVVAAAVWHEGMIYSLPRPARHHHILHKLHELGLPAAVRESYSSLEQGFLLSDGTFAGRAPAAAIAVTAGQVQKLTAPPELYSEDLW